MSKPPYTSTTAGRQAAAAEIERIMSDLEQDGRKLYAIYPPIGLRRKDGWRVSFVDKRGEVYDFDAETLTEAYLLALAWPGTPPPF